MPHPIATEMALGFRFTAERLYQLGFLNRLAEPDALIPTALVSIPFGADVNEFDKAGLTPYLDKLGFNLAGYGCTTCIGNAGDLAPELNQAIYENDLICAAVLSGNRNFEARIHPLIKANFLASPPLVVAYAIAGNANRDLMTEPVGRGTNGRDVYLGDIWPSSDEIHKLMKYAMNGKAFRANYGKVKSQPGPLWDEIRGGSGQARYSFVGMLRVAPNEMLGHQQQASGIGQAHALL